MWIANIDRASDAFALARVVRVARLSRISRILRVSFSQNLARMTSSISGSVHTITWATLLVILAVYVMAIVFRETVGRSSLEYETTGKYFDSVPRSESPRVPRAEAVRPQVTVRAKGIFGGDPPDWWSAEDQSDMAKMSKGRYASSSLDE